MPGPALAMLRIPGPVCFSWKFSSWNLAPAQHYPQSYRVALSRTEGKRLVGCHTQLSA